MGKKSALDIKDLFGLSDALGMELLLHKNGDVRGKTARSLEIKDLGLKMNMEPKIVSSRVEWKTSSSNVFPVISLLVVVHGDLVLWVTDDHKDDEITIRLIDWNAVPNDWGSTNMLFEELKAATSTMLKKLGVPPVAEFARGRYDQVWLPKKLLAAA